MFTVKNENGKYYALQMPFDVFFHWSLGKEARQSFKDFTNNLPQNKEEYLAWVECYKDMCQKIEREIKNEKWLRKGDMTEKHAGNVRYMKAWSYSLYQARVQTKLDAHERFMKEREEVSVS